MLVFVFDMNVLVPRLNGQTETGANYVDPQLVAENRNLPQEQGGDATTDLIALTVHEMILWADCLEYLGNHFLPAPYQTEIALQLMWANQKHTVAVYAPSCANGYAAEYEKAQSRANFVKTLFSED